MTRLSIDIPDDLKTVLDARAAAAGCSLQDYVESVVRTEAKMIDYCAAPHLQCQSRQQVESLILEGLATPTRELASQDWDRLRSELIQGHPR